MRGTAARLEKAAGSVTTKAGPGALAAHRSGRSGAAALRPTGATIARHAATARPGAGPWRPGEQLEFMFGEVAPRRRADLRLVRRSAVVASVSGPDGALEAPDCGCLLIEEHLDRCILRGRA